MDQICEICGKEFKPSPFNSSTCSEKCNVEFQTGMSASEFVDMCVSDMDMHTEIFDGDIIEFL
jgi:hypothetical protein